MRISDWSSDVCSSDLVTLPLRHFKSEIKKISKEDMLPDYRIALEERVNAAATKQVAKQIVMIAMRDVVEGPSISPAGDTTMQKRRETARKRSTETDPSRPFWEQLALRLKATRSEEPRFGKECVQTWRSRWWTE